MATVSTMHDGKGCPGCPVCGSIHTQRASIVVEERIRNAIATHWAAPPGARGPDGNWLRSGVIVWAGALAYATVVAERAWLVPIEWAGLLLGVIVTGLWADRRAARARGWVDPMRRAHEFACHARERDAIIDDAPFPSGASADAPDQAPREWLCLRCGHRFEPVPEPALLA